MAGDAQKPACNRLRLFVNRALLIDGEQYFHRREMRGKRALAALVYLVCANRGATGFACGRAFTLSAKPDTMGR